MATTVSFINMKGGVGKTTLATQVAHSADQANLKVLAVDLDPQSNLSQSLMGELGYFKHLRANKPTVVQLFDDFVPPSGSHRGPTPVDIDGIILKKAGFWGGTTLDLIPSRLELSRALKKSGGKGRRLARALAKIHDRYDLILIDCAPTESVLTDAAYQASRYILVPIKPEFMATIGLPLLARSLEEFKIENRDHEIDICGLVFNHSSSYSSGPESRRSISVVKKLAGEYGWPVFRNRIKYSASYAKSAREQSPISHTSYVRANVASGFGRFCSEFFASIGMEVELS